MMSFSMLFLINVQEKKNNNKIMQSANKYINYDE